MQWQSPKCQQVKMVRLDQLTTDLEVYCRRGLSSTSIDDGIPSASSVIISTTWI